MTDRIDIPWQTLEAAKQEIQAGKIMRKVAQELGVSDYCLRMNFKRAKIEISFGKGRRGGSRTKAEKARDQTMHERGHCRTWHYDLSTERLKMPLRNNV